VARGKPGWEWQGESSPAVLRAGASVYPALRQEPDWYWRGVWLGLLVGALLVLFFTPVSGPDLRGRLRLLVETWQVRIWNLLDRLEGIEGQPGRT
jgi:hypothetical protein